MTFFNEDFTLYTPTNIDTEKVAEIEKNPSVSVLLGLRRARPDDCYVEIAGTSKSMIHKKSKNNSGRTPFNNGFKVLKTQTMPFFKLQPETIRVLNNHGEPPQELNL